MSPHKLFSRTSKGKDRAFAFQIESRFEYSHFARAMIDSIVQIRCGDTTWGVSLKASETASGLWLGSPMPHRRTRSMKVNTHIRRRGSFREKACLCRSTSQENRESRVLYEVSSRQNHSSKLETEGSSDLCCPEKHHHRTKQRYCSYEAKSCRVFRGGGPLLRVLGGVNFLANSRLDRDWRTVGSGQQFREQERGGAGSTRRTCSLQQRRRSRRELELIYPAFLCSRVHEHDCVRHSTSSAIVSNSPWIPIEVIYKVFPRSSSRLAQATCQTRSTLKPSSSKRRTDPSSL